MKRQFSRFQIVCITLLWAALCYIVLTTAERIDGPIILTLVILWGIERSGFFNGREKWAKGFENQRV